jgi:hypothetical protein
MESLEINKRKIKKLEETKKKATESNREGLNVNLYIILSGLRSDTLPKNYNIVLFVLSSTARGS